MYDIKKIEDYVAGRFNDSERTDFEAIIAIDLELQKEVAKIILKKMLIEKKIREETEASEKIRQECLSVENKLPATERKYSYRGVRDWLKKIRRKKTND